MISIENFQQAEDLLRQALKKFNGEKFVTVGIHEGAAGVESGDLTMASLGAIHEFGADIDHPGGTSYGYATRAAADRDEVRFLKKGAGFMELGKTGPHKIIIPARPWLVPGVESATHDIMGIIKSGIEAGQTPDQTLEQVGIIAVGAVQQYMTDLQTPPNAPSTIRKKGSSNPLIDTGAMRAAVTHAVTSESLQEGL